MSTCWLTIAVGLAQVEGRTVNLHDGASKHARHHGFYRFFAIGLMKKEMEGSVPSASGSRRPGACVNNVHNVRA